MIKIWINGFGRIGRIALRIAEERSDLEVVAINSRWNAESHAHLLKYDSTYWVLDKEVWFEADGILVDGRKIAVLQNSEPKDIQWGKYEVDVVLDCVWHFRDKKTLQWHLDNWAKKVILAAPWKWLDATLVMGVNEKDYNSNIHHIISNASCTTNCLAPIVKILEENFGIISGIMTTVHAFTNDQNLLDNRHEKDFRRARSAYCSIIPTSTGAAEAVWDVLPSVKGKFTGIALRVPTETVSMVDLTVILAKNTSVEVVNSIFEKNKSVFCDITSKELVSIDYKWMKQSWMIDSKLTQVVWWNLLKIYSWYDNEWWYTERLVDMASYVL